MKQAETVGPKLKKTHNKPPDFHVGCVITNNRSSWCYRHCTPIKGLGACGRIAPHSIRSRTQRSIDAYKKKLAEAEANAE